MFKTIANVKLYIVHMFPHKHPQSTAWGVALKTCAVAHILYSLFVMSKV